MTKGSSFADIELGEGNANYVKTYDVLVGDKGRKHLMPKRGIAILCWSVALFFVFCPSECALPVTGDR